MGEPVCIFCGPRPAALWAEESGHRALKCSGCGLVYVWPRPPPGAVRQIYEHDGSATGARVHIAKTRAPHALAHARYTLGLIRPHARGVRLLELGPGGGLFLAEAHRAGFEVCGIEPNRRLAAFIREEQGLRCSSEPLSPDSFGGADFDVIYHCNVLSHFHDPVAVTRALAERLKPGGILVFETGNYADVAPEYAGLIRDTERFQLPEHLYFFGRRSMERLLEAAGLERVALVACSRVLEKRLPPIASRLRIRKLHDRFRHTWKYTIGAHLPLEGRPQAWILITRRR